MKRIICLILAVVLTLLSVFALGSCDMGFVSDETTEVEETTKAPKGEKDDEDEEYEEDEEEGTKKTQTIVEGYELSDSETNFVLIDVQNYGQIVVELYPETAPITVANFKKLVSERFYDGLIFHRVIENFMIQGGGYDTTYNERPAESIKGEFEANGIENDLSHTRGVISMARTNVMDSASSQFFIMHKDYTRLDGQYAAFGKTVYGIEVVDRIASVYTDYYDMPIQNVVIRSVSFVKVAGESN